MADRVTGRVILVGGGPRAADQITVRGLDRLMAADVVITGDKMPTTLAARRVTLGSHIGSDRALCEG